MTNTVKRLEKRIMETRKNKARAMMWNEKDIIDKCNKIIDVYETTISLYRAGKTKRNIKMMLDAFNWMKVIPDIKPELVEFQNIIIDEAFNDEQ